MPENKLVPEVPGFDKLPIEEQMLINAYKDNPGMMGVYQSTKILQLHTQHEKMDKRIRVLERSRARIKWTLAGAGTVLTFIHAVLIAKWAKWIG